MPELPEVETVRRYLEENIINHKIKDVVLSSKKSLRNVKEKELKVIIDQPIKKIDRIAKHLIIRLKDHYLVCHLRMEGKFFIFKDEKEMNELTNRFHDVMIIYTNKGIILFQDTRRFATVDLFNEKVSYEDNSVLSVVGPEVFDKEPKELFNTLSRKTIAIKSALLDQTIMSGLGNIYVDEVLFKAKLHPETKSNTITIDEAKDIVKHSRQIIKKAIDNKGTTIRSYTSSLGVEGSYQKYLNVHQQLGKQCKVCGSDIKKIKVGGRGTYLCETCQIKRR